MEADAGDFLIAAGLGIPQQPLNLLKRLGVKCCGDDVLPAIADDSERCVALYYLGARALVEGRREDATHFFQSSLDTDQRIEDEYWLARWHLKRLAGDPKASDPQP